MAQKLQKNGLKIAFFGQFFAKKAQKIAVFLQNLGDFWAKFGQFFYKIWVVLE